MKLSALRRCAAFGLMLCILFMTACVRGRGEQIIPEEIPAEVCEVPAEAAAGLPTAPVTMYREAVESYLCPLDDYSWERTHTPEFVMIHFTSAVVEHREDPYNNTYLRSLFLDGGISVHYLIQRDGTVYCYMPENREAWHAGVGEWQEDPKYSNTMNHYAIGIELAAIGSAADMEGYLSAGAYETLDENLIGFTEAQYASLDGLITDLCSRYGIPKDEEHIIGHAAYSPEKNDPGELFDWNRILPGEK